MDRITAISLALLMVLAVAVYRAKLAATDTRGTLDQTRRNIAQLEEDIAILRAEQAHLERPQRIDSLARRHLGLVPVQARQIGSFSDLIARNHRSETAGQNQ